MEGGGAHQPNDTDTAETSRAAAAPPSLSVVLPGATPSALEGAIMSGTLSHGGRFIQYTVSGKYVFEVTSKYKPPIGYVGKGSYGILCSALNSETGERVAIKKMSTAFDNEAFAKRTIREIKILRGMDHENIIAIRDIIPPAERQAFNDVYVAYELMDFDLYDVIKSEFCPTEEHKQYLLYQILRGLKYIHSANVLHRDIKPSNLLINANCDLKICDFGFSRITSELDMSHYIATRWYRAPELLLNSSAYTAAIDVWSVGCVFMEMVMRKPLFPGEDHARQLKQILKLIGTPNDADLGFATRSGRWYMSTLPYYAPQSFSLMFPEVSPAAIDLVERMLKFDPRQRITVDEALAHPYLAAFHSIDDEPVCPTPLSFDFEQGEFSVEQAKEIIYAEALAMNPDYQISSSLEMKSRDQTSL